MAVISYIRGHLVQHLKGKWVYSDNGESMATIRPCGKCGEMPTPEGYDACLGYIEGAKSACCGHGVNAPMIMWKD